MSEPTPVHIPLITSNEPDAMLVDLFIENGLKVHNGDILCTLETTKSTIDFSADTDGFVSGLKVQVGDIVTAGEILCYLAESENWIPPKEQTNRDRAKVKNSFQTANSDNLPKDLRITKPALELATSNNINLNTLPLDRLITKEFVQVILKKDNDTSKDMTNDIVFQREKIANSSEIVVYGGGGHGKSVIELIIALGTYTILGIIDDGLEKNDTIMNIPILGGQEILPKLSSKGIYQAVNAVGGIGDINSRKNVFNKLKDSGLNCPSVVHPAAFIEPSAEIEDGIQVFPKAYVGSEVHIGFGSIINTGAIVSHECIIGAYANISPGAILAGNVRIGDSVLVGMGVTINLNVEVGNGARIGNGATIKSDVPDNGIIRAGSNWPDY